MNQVARTAGRRKGKSAPVALTDALETLRANRPTLEALGVVHASIFGSVARGEAESGSDLDVVVELDDAKIRSVYDFAGVWRAISDLFSVSVDVVERDALRERMKQRVEADLVNAF
jgi:hypothetical protein